MSAAKIVNARHLALYPKDCLCQVATSLGQGDFALIALFLNGARLMGRGPEEQDILMPGMTAHINISLTLRGLFSGPFPCLVRDAGPADAFLAFGKPLGFSFLGAMRDNPRHFA